MITLKRCRYSSDEYNIATDDQKDFKIRIMEKNYGKLNKINGLKKKNRIWWEKILLN